jgi:hypothetical protein
LEHGQQGIALALTSQNSLDGFDYGVEGFYLKAVVIQFGFEISNHG